MSSQPAFAATPLSFKRNIITANANRDGSGTISILCTAPTGGLRIDNISMKALQTTTAGMIRMWHYNGSVYSLIREFIVTAITASGTMPSWEQQLTGLGIVLESGWSLAFSTDKGESFDICATNAGGFA